MNYSNFIKAIKYGFLVTSVSITLLIINNNLSNKSEVILNQKTTNNEFSSISQILHKPMFMSIDNKKQPFKVMAAKATRFKNEPNIFNLDNPTGEIKSGDEVFFLSGIMGFNKDIQQLKVNGNVKFKNESDMVFQPPKCILTLTKKFYPVEKKLRVKNKFLIISEALKY